MPHYRDDSDEDDDRELPDPSDMDSGDEQDLIDKCPRCGKLMYDDGEQCPHCGEYVSHNDNRLHPMWVIITAAVLLIGFVLLYLH